MADATISGLAFGFRAWSEAILNNISLNLQILTKTTSYPL